MSDAKTLADTLDCMADLCEDTSGREMRTFRDAAKLLLEQERRLAKWESAPVVALLIDGRAEETLGSLQYDTGRFELVARPTEE